MTKPSRCNASMSRRGIAQQRKGAGWAVFRGPGLAVSNVRRPVGLSRFSAFRRCGTQRRRTLLVSAGAALIAALAGCAVGPDYQPPQTHTPASWAEMPAAVPATRPAAPATQPSRAVAGGADVTTWWRSLNDPALDSLIAHASQSNLDLRIAEARVREARALRGTVAAGLWPQLNAGAAYNYRGASLNAGPKAEGGPGLGVQARNAAVGAAVRSAVTPPFTVDPTQVAAATVAQVASGAVTDRLGGMNAGVSRDQNLFQTGFDASWEIDIFGGVRRSVEAADADVAAAEEGRHDVVVTLLAEVARSYVQLREFQRRLAIARETISSQRDTVELTRTRFKAGLTSELDVAQAKAQLAATQSQVPFFEATIRQTIHQLGVLIGRPPGTLLEELTKEAPIPTTPPEVPVGLPSDLLRRRPDVRRAERELAGATARIGVATADLFPRFSLTGSFGPQTRDFRHMLDWQSFGWAVGPSVRWPVFDGWRIRSNIEATNARQEQLLAAYERTVLVSLQDVENALVGYANEQVRHDALAEAVASNRRALDLSNELYSKGLIAFLNVLESQRALYATQDQLIQSEAAVVANLIALYKALGGGWTVESGPMAAR